MMFFKGTHSQKKTHKIVLMFKKNVPIMFFLAIALKNVTYPIRVRDKTNIIKSKGNYQ
jgi:hypothetical protein